MYDIINSKIFPVIGNSDSISVTTKAFYDNDVAWLIAEGLAGKPHGQRLGGLAIDLSTDKINYPVVTTQYETMLAQNGSYQWPDGSAGGLGFTSYTDDFKLRYLHLQNSTVAAQTMMNGLIGSASNANIYRFTLPPGYQIGNVGNTSITK
jgi:hypothetical protein